MSQRVALPSLSTEIFQMAFPPSVYDSPQFGFVSLSWLPPEGWPELEVTHRPGIGRLRAIANLEKGDPTYYEIGVNNGRYPRLNLTVQGLLKRGQNDAILHVCGLIKRSRENPFFSGSQPYWGQFRFDDFEKHRINGFPHKICILPETYGKMHA